MLGYLCTAGGLVRDSQFNVGTIARPIEDELEYLSKLWLFEVRPRCVERGLPMEIADSLSPHDPPVVGRYKDGEERYRSIFSSRVNECPLSSDVGSARDWTSKRGLSLPDGDGKKWASNAGPKTRNVL